MGSLRGEAIRGLAMASPYPPVPAIEIEFAGNARADPGFGVARFGGGCRRGASATMIPVPSGVRVWPAVGRTDMRKGMDRLAAGAADVGLRPACGRSLRLQ